MISVFKNLTGSWRWACLLLTVLPACTPPDTVQKTRIHENEVPVLVSTPPSKNITPYSSVLECYGEQLVNSDRDGVSIAIGNIRDYTGKSSDSEGFAITQGGSLMAYSALGRIAPGVVVHERFDTQIADAELQYIANRQLGDGSKHEMPDPATGEPQEVSWMPYFGGSVLRSDYYIVGGITELNFNIQTGGAEFAINQVGAKRRVYTMNVGVDMRVVGSQTLKVYDTVSLQKQLTGYEVGFGVFRFFGSDLYDVNAGMKEQEPLQLAVRTVIENAVLELVASVTGVDPLGCADALRVKYDDANFEKL
jgi:curli production assembly/transport component CsgG/holdfast attachment protein HfaB